MKIPQFIVAGALAVIVSMQAWQMLKLVDVSEKLAALTAKVEASATHKP